MYAQASRLGILLCVFLAAGCAASGEGGDREFRDPNVLTLEQIEAVRVTNAYEAVVRLRSRWLRARGQTQISGGSGEDFEVQAYLDDQKLRGVTDLQNIEIAAVEYIRYFPPTEASARWGFGHGAGAILVSTRPLER